MSRYLKAAAVASFAVLCLVPMASAHRRVIVTGGVGFFGPAWYHPYGWGYGYGYPVYLAPVPTTGEVKIKAAKDALVYVDEGYAGTAGKLKRFALAPGTHTIELRDPSGHTYYQEHVAVIRGKTVEIDAGPAR